MKVTSRLTSSSSRILTSLAAISGISSAKMLCRAGIFSSQFLP